MNTITLGSDAQFAAVRDCFRRSQFEEAEVCRRFGIAKLASFEDEFDRKQVEAWDRDACGVLIRLFIEGQYLPLGVLEQHLGPDALEGFAALGLLESKPDDPSMLSVTAAVYPCAGVLIASDRWNRADGAPFQPGADVVYPAIVSTAQRFLESLPRTRCERFLDLCSGTGVAALQAANRFADNAWAFDIAERATLFGEWNRRLNGISNAVMETGDLYSPANGRTFDRVVAHPPYVPVLRPKWIFHDGGEDGEQIVRRCVSELPAYLEPGGLFYLLAMGTDRESAPYEQRIRQWLGENSPGFDVLVFPIRNLDPDDFAVRTVAKSQTAMEDTRRFKQLFRELQVKSMVYSFVLIQRVAEAREPFTLRRNLGPGSGIEQMLWLLDWETRFRRPGGVDAVLGARLRSNRDSELRVVHRLGDEGWQVTEHVLQITSPFAMEARSDPWIPYLMNFCNGEITVAEHFDRLKTEGVVPDAPPEEFARAVSMLVSGGFLRVEE